MRRCSPKPRKRREGPDKPRRRPDSTEIKPKLETFWQLDEPSLAKELKRAGLKPSAAAWKQICEEFGRSRGALLPLLARANQIEREQHEEVFRLYGLTVEDIALIRATRAPRDPLSLVE